MCPEPAYVIRCAGQCGQFIPAHGYEPRVVWCTECRDHREAAATARKQKTARRIGARA